MKNPIAASLLVAATALAGGYALAQMPPPPGSEPAPSTSPGGAGKPTSSGDVKSECTTAAKKAGLNGKELDDYVKQCISKGGAK